MLSDDAVRQIHQGSLEVLEQTGVFVEDDAALDIFSDGGARVDRETHMVCLPGELVETTIASARADESDHTRRAGEFLQLRRGDHVRRSLHR